MSLFSFSWPFQSRIRLLSWLVSLLVLSGCSATPKFQLLQDVLSAGLSPDEVSVLMIPINTKQRELALQPDRLLQPASTMKLLTTVVALDELGVNWSGETQIRVQQSDVHRQTLAGPLIVKGRSNTDLSYAELNFMLRQLYDQGVRHIPSGIQVDRTQFNPQRPAPTNQPFDEAPRARYNHVPDPLMLQQNMHWLSLQSDMAGVKGWFSPSWKGLQLEVSGLKLVHQRCDSFSIHQQQFSVQQLSSGEWQIQVRGEFPIQCQWQGQLELLDRDLNLQLAIQNDWQQLGGTIGNKMIFKAAEANSQLLVQHLGRPLPEIVYRINKYSDNALARLVYANLASTATALPTTMTTTEASDRFIDDWLRQRQISAAGLVVDNGSGLSRRARISARQLAAVLAAGWSAPYSAEFVASLPLAGVDGTLRQRLKNGPAYQRARLKTGTLRDVTALAGYVWDQQNQPWIFVGIVNSDQAAQKGRALLDKWVQQLAGQ